MRCKADDLKRSPVERARNQDALLVAERIIHMHRVLPHEGGDVKNAES